MFVLASFSVGILYRHHVASGAQIYTMLHPACMCSYLAVPASWQTKGRSALSLRSRKWMAPGVERLRENAFRLG